MTKSKRNLLVSVIVLILTVAIAGGSTYAWFTTNQRVTVADMNMSVTTGTQGLYVSVDPDKGFKTALTADDLLAAGYNPGNLKLDNVTSADGMAITNLAGAAITHPGANAAASYAQFTVYFRVTGLEQASPVPVVNLEDNLDLKGTVSDRPTYSDFEIKNIGASYGKTSLLEGESDTIGIRDRINGNPAHAMRMSYATQPFNFTVVDTTNKYYTGTDTARVWDPFYANPATFCGLANNGKYDNSTGNFALDYYNKLVDDQKRPESDKLTFPVSGIAAVQEKADFKTNVLKFAWNDTTKAWEGKLTVRIWIEGYDGDCINAILGGGAMARMNFVIPQA